MTMRHNTIGVALSGGGHRASLFGLGALLYLVDAGKGAYLGSVASVSGGSLTNAYFGLNVDLATVTPEMMWQQAQQFTYKVARRGTLWASPLTYLYLLGIALMPLAGLTVSYLFPGWRSGLAWIVVFVLGGWLLQQRSAVAAAAFACTLLGKATLSSMKDSVCHIICATDLQTGQDVFFAKSFVYSWRTGWGAPGRMRVARAAQASAALPGAFSVVSMPLKRFGLCEQRSAAQRRPALRRFKLLDGGVYDNMGTEWLLNIGDRMRDPKRPPAIKPVDDAIVVNASAGDDVIQRRLVTVPFIGEVASLLAVKDVMYRQTTAVRRRLLDVRYRLGQMQDPDRPGERTDRDALRGVTIQIDRSPFDLPTAFSHYKDALATRAEAALRLLDTESDISDAREFWADEAQANRTVKTTLSRIEAARARSLIRHGYVLTMVNSHVLLDYPLRPAPADKFATLGTRD
jgi:predicted acylesterase/phospholipase RssA